MGKIGGKDGTRSQGYLGLNVDGIWRYLLRRIHKGRSCEIASGFREKCLGAVCDRGCKLRRKYCCSMRISRGRNGNSCKHT